MTPLAAAKTTFEFETDSCKVEVTIKSDGLSAKIEVPMEEFGKGVKGYYEAEVSNFKVTNKIDYMSACIFSSAVSALKCTKVGARDGVPKLNEVIDFLKERGFNEFKEKLEQKIR